MGIKYKVSIYLKQTIHQCEPIVWLFDDFEFVDKIQQTLIEREKKTIWPFNRNQGLLLVLRDYSTSINIPFSNISHFSVETVYDAS